MRWFAVTAMVVCPLATCLSDELPKLTTSKSATPTSVAPAIAKEMGPTAYVVSIEGKEVARFWIRSTTPSKAKGANIAYTSIVEGTLLGVLEIKEAKLTDFRKQALPTGVFVLRMGYQPQDGNHMGVAPGSEFACLTPASVDTSADAIPHKELMKVSKKSAGTTHPTVLFLQPFFAKPTFSLPTINTNEFGHAVLNVPAKATLADNRTVDFPLGMVIVGTTTAE